MGKWRVGVLMFTALTDAVAAQGGVPLAPGTTLFTLDLSRTPAGDFPASLDLLKGIMEVVIKNGVPMLKASAASEFRITLPQGQVLPQDFTLEFDLVPKLGSNPQDLSFEGTPTINQGSASAHVLWHATGYLAVIGGGGDTYEAPMPEDLRATLPGVLTQVVAVFQGNTLNLYTNGRRHYTLNKQFARGRVLRVFVGAQDGGTEAVYLAGLRIGTGPAAPGLIGQGAATSGSAFPRGPATKPRPVNTAGSTVKTAARCQPSGTSGAPPLNYQVGGGRVGGAVVQWWTETGAEYLVERSPDAGNGNRVWSRLTSTCDFPSALNYSTLHWEDGNDYPVISLSDNVPGLQLDAPYVYRVTVIRSDGTSGSGEASYTTANATFPSSPIAAVNGNTVRLAADVSYCTATAYAPFMRCDPWMMELTVTNSSSGYRYSSQQPWKDSYDPHLPLTVPGGVEATYVFIISGVPSGTHTFTVTALYQPDHRIVAGSVTVQVP